MTAREPLTSNLLLPKVAGYLETQIDALEECHTNFDTGELDGQVCEEIEEVRGWIKELRALAGAADGTESSREPSEATPGGGSDTSQPIARGVAMGQADETSVLLRAGVCSGCGKQWAVSGDPRAVVSVLSFDCSCGVSNK